MDLLITKRRAIFPRPGDSLACSDLQKKTQLLVEEGIVIPEIEPEERIGLGEGAASGNDLRATFRDQIERGKFLKDSHRISGTQHGDRTCEANLFRTGCCGCQQNDRCRVEELFAVMLPKTPSSLKRGKKSDV